MVQRNENAEKKLEYDFSGIMADLEGGWYEPQAGEETENYEVYTDAETRESVCEPSQLRSKIEVSELAEAVQENDRISQDWSGSPVYTVNGAMLPEYLQAYLYERLSQFGIAWFYRYALCQIYQESRFDPAAVSFDGKDHGLCQFRERFFADYASQAGLYTWDINNPIDQLYVYTWLMARNLSATNGDIGWALSMYYMGEAIYCERYVADVLQWESTMGVANGS